MGGSPEWRNWRLAIKTLSPDKILLLGDYLYNGPRNGVPTDYDPMAVSQKLNLYKDKIIGVRGNAIRGSMMSFWLSLCLITVVSA
jgi:predicted phosphodiesterase